MPADAPGRWTTLADLRAASRTAWERGALLREVLEPTGAYPRRRALRKPTAAELRDHYAAARSWAGELTAGEGAFSLEFVDAGRTTIGTNRVPAAAVFATVDDEITFAGRRRDALRVVDLARQLAEVDPALRGWALARPLQLLVLGADALRAARVAVWLRDHPSPGIYVRQLSLAGVHTKFVEGHRRTISDMLAVLQPMDGPAESDDVPASVLDPVLAPVLTSAPRSPAARFAARHGFLHAPERVRFRVLDPSLSVLGSARDLTVTAEAFGALSLPVDRVVVTENLVNFLAVPERPGTLALFGEGYGFSALADAAWLRGCTVSYWGDLDTHGFQILDQLRVVHPQVASVLMDDETLLAHRDRWGTEPTPSRAVLTRLTEEEAAVHAALQDDTYGPAVRLEQELVRWEWALERLL